MSLRIVFMGTPEFAVPSLKALVRAGYEVVGVVCQPDRPRGRSGKLAPCEVKAAALELGLYQLLYMDGIPDSAAVNGSAGAAPASAF